MSRKIMNSADRFGFRRHATGRTCPHRGRYPGGYPGCNTGRDHRPGSAAYSTPGYRGIIAPSNRNAGINRWLVWVRDRSQSETQTGDGSGPDHAQSARRPIPSRTNSTGCIHGSNARQWHTTGGFRQYFHASTAIQQRSGTPAAACAGNRSRCYPSYARGLQPGQSESNPGDPSAPNTAGSAAGRARSKSRQCGSPAAPTPNDRA